MPDIDLICLDFDGTAVEYDGENAYFHPAAVDLLNALESRGIQWCTNSGRDIRSQRRILDLSREKGLVHMPVAALCSESFIYQPESPDKYVSCEPWNSSAMILLRRFNERVQRELEEHVKAWSEIYEQEVLWYDSYTVFRLDDVEHRPARFALEVRKALRDVPHVTVTRNGGWVMVLPEQMGKGNILREYLKISGISPDRVLAIGDHINDLSMLDGSAAGCVGCPGDAVPEVLKVVGEAGGYIAKTDGPEGTVEVVRHYLGPNGEAVHPA